MDIEPDPATPAAVLLAQALQTLLLEALESPRGQAAMRQAMSLTPLKPVQAPRAPDPSPPPTVTENAEPEPAYTAPGGRKPRALVVGLLGSQADTIRSEFAGDYDLRFLTQDAPTYRLIEHARGTEVAFAMVGKSGHAVDHALKKGSPDFRRVNGSVGELRRLMRTYLMQQELGALSGSAQH